MLRAPSYQVWAKGLNQCHWANLREITRRASNQCFAFEGEACSSWQSPWTMAWEGTALTLVLMVLCVQCKSLNASSISIAGQACTSVASRDFQKPLSTIAGCLSQTPREWCFSPLQRNVAHSLRKSLQAMVLYQEMNFAFTAVKLLAAQECVVHVSILLPNHRDRE